MPIADPDTFSTQRLRSSKTGFIGKIVPNEQRPPSGKAGGLHQHLQCFALINRCRPDFYDALTVLQGPARISLLSTFEALDSGATPPPSWLGCTFEMPADLDADTFAAALRLWINRHDTLRSMLVPLDAPMANSQLQRFTLDPGTVDIEHVTVDTAAAIARHEPLSTVIEYLFDEQVGPCRWPGYLLLTISHSRATTVCLAVDHSLIDGYGLLKLPRELHMLYAVAQGTQAPLPPAESYPDFAEAERREAEALTASDETVQRWQHCLEAFGGTLPPVPDQCSSSRHHGTPSARWLPRTAG